jgi:SNF2 family DNA or RNA helicase
VEFVRALWKSGRRGAMLAMVMGSGKSRVAVKLTDDAGARRVLIVCPLRVVEVWRSQFARFASRDYEFLPLDERCHNVRRKTDMARLALERGQSVVIAINYDSARTEPFASWALNQIWDLVILDESHRVKAPGGRNSRWCAQLGLRAHYRLALTGTPMAHEPTDIWAQFRFLQPGFLDPSFGSFKRRHAVMGGYFNKQVVKWKDLDQLHDKFRQLAFRVNEDVLDLPAALDEVLSTSLDPAGQRLYREMEEEMVAWIHTTEAAGIPVSAANAMVRLLRLEQITGGTVRDEQGRDHLVDHAKEQLLADFLEDLDPHEPVVVFARFRSDLAAIRRAAAQLERRSGELSGEHNDDLARWQRGDQRDPVVLAVQMQAGGVGIDLTRARIAVYYSIGFSLADYLQSRARIHRPPQQRPCVFYHLQIRNSVDEYILRAVLARQELIQATLDELKTKQRSTHARTGTG